MIRLSYQIDYSRRGNVHTYLRSTNSRYPSAYRWVARHKRRVQRRIIRELPAIEVSYQHPTLPEASDLRERDAIIGAILERAAWTARVHIVAVLI